MNRLVTILAMCKLANLALALSIVLGYPLSSNASLVEFSGPYDNTENTVTGSTPNYNQTSGNYRDIWWWRINNGQPAPNTSTQQGGTDDFINYGKNLVQVGITAVDNGTGQYDALNFTGPTANGRQSYMTIYDTTPEDGAATKNTFGLGTVADPLKIVTDVWFAGPGHNVSAGIMSLYNESNDGLALLLNQRTGNNADNSFVSLVWDDFTSTAVGNAVTLASVNLGVGAVLINEWYRITMELWEDPAGSWNVKGYFQLHTDDNPASDVLGPAFGLIQASGSLANPDPDDPVGNSLTNPGEIGLIVQGRESISLPDSVGVSFYLHEQSMVPEPMSLFVWALLIGAVGLVSNPRRRNVTE